MPPHPSLRERIRLGDVKVPRRAALARESALAAAPQAAPLTGGIKALAVVVDFSDKVHTVTASFFDSLIFAAPAAGRGSVRDYYNEVSYGQVDIYTVNLPSSLGWVRAPLTYSYYVNNNYGTDSPYPHNCRKLAEDIVDAVHDLGVDFSQYDNNGDGEAEPIMLIHAGPGAEFTGKRTDIWSHSWSLKNPRTYDGVTISRYVIMPEYWLSASSSTSDMTIGVFAHEMGHGFWDLPDLYDTTYSSAGIGNWSLMAGGSWNGPNSLGGYPDGSSPAWPDAYCRVQMGFVSPAAGSGDLSLPQAYDNPAPAPTVLQLSSLFNTKEYYLLENRQRVSGSYDEYLPAGGLLIWHVDENVATDNYRPCTAQADCSCPLHYLVSLEQADGLKNLEKGQNEGDAGDPFPGSANKRSWTMATIPSSGSFYNCGDSGLAVNNISNSQATMTLTVGPSMVVADFSADVTVGMAPLSVQFTDASTGAISTWSWTFGDGGASSEPSPSHTYKKPGSYNVNLTVSGPGGASSKSATITVYKKGAPKAAFTATPKTGPAPLPVQFTNASTGWITDYYWEFGDGNTSTEPSPTHIYADAGKYKATLTATGPGGSKSKSTTIKVTP
jgi:immune inhibitor A